MKISVLFSIDDVTLTDQQREAMHQLTGEWTIINRRTGRMLIDALADDSAIPVIAAALADYLPTIYGAWDIHGRAVLTSNYPQNPDGYLTMMPDVIEMDEEGNVIDISRPSEPRFIHSFSGWRARTWI